MVKNSTVNHNTVLTETSHSLADWNKNNTLEDHKKSLTGTLQMLAGVTNDRLVIYNKIGKCGSTTAHHVMKIFGGMNYMVNDPLGISCKGERVNNTINVRCSSLFYFFVIKAL